jgi:hypothetical protein
MSDLYRLVYYSHSRLPASTEAMADSVDSILDAACRNNPRLGVTGALMFNRGCFAQVLEGTRESVARTFERIQQDPRHGDVSLLEFAPAKARAFENWSMAFVGASVQDAAKFGAIAGESGYDPAKMSAEALFRVLQALVLEDEVA